MSGRLTPARRVTLVLGGAYALTLVAYGVLTLVSWAGRTTAVVRTVAAASSPFTVRTGAGDIDVRTSPDGNVHVEARLRYGLHKPKLTLVSTSAGVRAGASCWGIDPVCAVDYVVAVPRGVSLVAQSSSGDVRVDAVLGDVALTTGSGDVTVRGASGALVLRSGSGDVDASGVASASVDVRTGSGDLSLRCISSPTSLRAQTGSGDVSVVVPSGQAYDVQADTGSGDVLIGVPRESGGGHRIELRTGSGDVSVRPGV